MAQMRTDHQEAMAHGVLNIIAENYPALEEVFKGMGVLDTSKADLRRPGVEEPFTTAIQRCMTGGALAQCVRGRTARADRQRATEPGPDGFYPPEHGPARGARMALGYGGISMAVAAGSA